MDTATYETIEVTSAPPTSQPSEELECWHSNTTGQAALCAKDRPEVSDIRVPGIVQEASTAYTGAEAQGVWVDELGRPHGISKVCVWTGAVPNCQELEPDTGHVWVRARFGKEAAASYHCR